MIDYKWVTGRPTVQLAFIIRPRTALNPFVEWPPAQYYFLYGASQFRCSLSKLTTSN